MRLFTSVVLSPALPPSHFGRLRSAQQSSAESTWRSNGEPTGCRREWRCSATGTSRAQCFWLQARTIQP
eukprot:6495641-Pyramimonas_sp.AAC.1